MEVAYEYAITCRRMVRLGEIVESADFNPCKAYSATEMAFVECVEGKPYSSAAEADMVILERGGESGRGRHNMSFKKPVRNTPDARICTILPSISRNFPHYPQRTHPLPIAVCPHQKRIGKTTMKKLCVPRFAVIEKYESSAGERIRLCRTARYWVSQRRRGMRNWRAQ